MGLRARSGRAVATGLENPVRLRGAEGTGETTTTTIGGGPPELNANEYGEDLDEEELELQRKDPHRLVVKKLAEGRKAKVEVEDKQRQLELSHKQREVTPQFKEACNRQEGKIRDLDADITYAQRQGKRPGYINGLKRTRAEHRYKLAAIKEAYDTNGTLPNLRGRQFRNLSDEELREYF